MKSLKRCKEIYRQAFNDGDIAFETALFETCYSCVRTVSVEGKIASMLFALPCEIKVFNQTKSAVYIYAAATLQEYRKMGLMSRLLNEVKVENKEKIIFLRPANKELIPFYEQFGFVTIKAVAKLDSNVVARPIAEFSLLKDLAQNADGSVFDLMYFSNEKINFNELAFAYSME